MGKAQRNKGRKGEREAKAILADRDYTILADTTAGIGCDDLVVQDSSGVIWSVEVKNQVSINVREFRKQAIANAKGNRWMLLCKVDGENSWMVFRKGMELTTWRGK